MQVIKTWEEKIWKQTFRKRKKWDSKGWKKKESTEKCSTSCETGTGNSWENHQSPVVQRSACPCTQAHCVYCELILWGIKGWIFKTLQSAIACAILAKWTQSHGCCICKSGMKLHWRFVALNSWTTGPRHFSRRHTIPEEGLFVLGFCSNGSLSPLVMPEKSHCRGVGVEWETTCGFTEREKVRQYSFHTIDLVLHMTYTFGQQSVHK